MEDGILMTVLDLVLETKMEYTYTFWHIADKLSEVENLVFVGGFAEVAQGIKTSLTDIDIVITNLEDVSFLFPLDDEWDREGYRKRAGKRIMVGEDDWILVDIFVKDSLPDYDIIEGYKVCTKEEIFTYAKQFKYFTSEKRDVTIKRHLEYLKNNKINYDSIINSDIPTDSRIMVL